MRFSAQCPCSRRPRTLSQPRPQGYIGLPPLDARCNARVRPSPRRLPPRLSESDLEQFFALLSDDVAAIQAQFRSDHRLPAALMLLFMRVAGRPLDDFNVLPRSLLRKTAEALGVSPPSIASLRSIYKRRQTRSKKQLWAKTYLGLRKLEPDDEAALTATLLAQAAATVP